MFVEETDYIIQFFSTPIGSVSLTRQEACRIAGKFEREVYEPGEDFCRIGTKCQKIGIVFSGLLRAYTLYDPGQRKKISDLFFPGFNDVVTDWDSILLNTESDHSIGSVNKTILLCISLYSLEKLCSEIPSLQKFLSRMIYKSQKAKIRFMEEYAGLNCKQQKEKFKTENPAIFDLLPLTELATLFNHDKGAFCEKKRP